MAGVLLIWAVLPLPFLYIVLHPFWITAVAVGTILIVRPAARVHLSRTHQNVIGIVILVLVAAAGGAGVGPLRPLGHLLILLTSVRAIQVVDRRTLIGTMPTVFLVWMASLTASTHVSVLVYFGLSIALWWWVGMQVQLDSMTEKVPKASRTVIRGRHAVAAAVLAMLVAIPVFLVMPRLRTPWIAGRGGLQSVTGFSSQVELSGVGSIRLSQEEALVVRHLEGKPIDERWMRLRGVAYERVTADSWAPRSADAPAALEAGWVRVHPSGWTRATTEELEITIRRPKKYLFLPDSTVAVDPPVAVRVDPAGGIVLAGSTDGPLTYRVLVTRGEAPRFSDPPSAQGRRIEPDPGVLALAGRITAGAAGPEEQATAIEKFLREEFTYSLQGMTRIGPDPVTWFLLESREGHCEYFAGGMVVLLDALGVPARMVGGYNGGSRSPDGAEVEVREANAHTWVEVWLGSDRGWEVFDPTPAVGVPGITGVDRRQRLRDLWEWVQASWDRYVLTYGIGEQLELLGAMAEAVLGVASKLGTRGLALLGASVLLAWSIVRWGRRRTGDRPLLRRRMRRPPAAQAVELLRRRLERCGEKVPVGVTVRGIGISAGDRWPGASREILELVWRAERELYSGKMTDRRAEIRRLWRSVRRSTTVRAR